VLPAPDDFGLASLEIGYVDSNGSCPDPGVCEQPAGDQLDVMIMAMTAGSSGMSDPGAEVGNFALILSDGSQARTDSITCDNSVQYALCGLGPEGAGATFGAEIFFDVPIGTNWTTVNFRYSSGGNTEVFVSVTRSRLTFSHSGGPLDVERPLAAGMAGGLRLRTCHDGTEK
jgi:hypothetical protein